VVRVPDGYGGGKRLAGQGGGCAGRIDQEAGGAGEGGGVMAARRRTRRVKRVGQVRARKSITYGVLPEYHQFVQDIRDIDPDGDGQPYLPAGKTYTIQTHANSGDAGALRQVGIKPVGSGGYGKLRFELNDRQLYRTIKKLKDSPYDEEEHLAGAIMSTLGYEWI